MPIGQTIHCQNLPCACMEAQNQIYVCFYLPAKSNVLVGGAVLSLDTGHVH